MYDVVIIGMGISGISAAIYAKQANLNVLLLEGSAPGGLLNSIDKIENFAGITSISGPDFALNLFNQVNENNIEYKLEEVKEIKKEEKELVVITNNCEYKCKNIVIATGRKPRLLGLENEKEFLGKGISTCALCDGSFYKGKAVAVVGAGNSALQEALYLSNIVDKIYLIMRRKIFAGSPAIVEKVKNTKNIEVLLETQIKKINIEAEKFSGLILNNDDYLDVAALFVYAGYVPNTEFLKNLDILNNNNYIEVNDNLETSIEGVFAIGDATRKDIYQLMNAAADGARVVGKLRK